MSSSHLCVVRTFCRALAGAARGALSPAPVGARTRRHSDLVTIRSSLVFAGLVTAVAVLVAGPARADPAAWVWPLAPRPEVVRGFDPPDSPWGAGHRGVDLLGTERQQVRAAGTGVVTYAGLLAGRGVVTISHGSLATTYEPVTASLGVGTAVRAGDPVGRLANVQSHCAPRVCLHFGALRDGSYVDPLGLLGAGRPRLLPLGPPPTAARVSATGDRAPSRPPRPTDEVARPAAGDSPPPVPLGVARSGTAGTPAPTPPADDGTKVRERSASISTLTAPAAGAVAGAITAGIVVRLTGKGTEPSPSRPPPAAPPAPSGALRRARGGVVDLDAVRQRLRGAA